MKIPFQKYHGSGNDFILIDNRDGRLEDHSPGFAQKICDRHFGIGSDGLVLVEQEADVDFKMVFYNPDGSQSLCGNGSRCAVAFGKSLGIVSDKALFTAFDGPHEAWVKESLVGIKMNDVVGVVRYGEDLFVDTGSPHYIKYVEDVTKVDLVNEARKIRYGKRFAEQGTNVNFVAQKADKLQMRTYERGVEAETLSCGTGVTAAAISAVYKGLFEDEVCVETKGGILHVKMEKAKEGEFQNIWLEGETAKVFEGEFDLASMLGSSSTRF